jgi:hypothetical protein
MLPRISNKLTLRPDNDPSGDSTYGFAPMKCCRPFFVVALVILAIDANRPTQAQSFCATYDDGSKSCGIPSLTACQQSVSGVGGTCAPDETSQLQPDFFNRRRLFQPLPDGTPPDQGGTFGGNLNQMPPPPDE